MVDQVVGLAYQQWMTKMDDQNGWVAMLGNLSIRHTESMEANSASNLANSQSTQLMCQLQQASSQLQASKIMTDSQACIDTCATTCADIIRSRFNTSSMNLLMFCYIQFTKWCVQHIELVDSIDFMFQRGET